MRHDKPASILNPGGEEPLSLLPGGGDDWLSRINSTINNFRELLKVAAQFKQLTQGGEAMEPQDTGPGSPAKSPGLADYVQLAIQAGYGDIPIGKLIEELSPFTLSQVLEVIRNARPKK